MLDHGAVISMGEGARDAGKSFPMMIRTFGRALRNGSACVWLRRTEEEEKNWLSEFGSTRWTDLCRLYGIEFKRLRRQGNKILINLSSGGKDSGSWRKLIRAGALSDWASFRDTSDPREDTIYLDEATTTLERVRRYNGNEVEHGLDILKSLRRGDCTARLVLGGNPDKPVNPWLDYFGIDRPAIDSGVIWLTPTDHIRTLTANGWGDRIAYEAIPHRDGSPALVKGAESPLLAPVPKSARLYANVDFGRRLSLWTAPDGLLYVSVRPVAGTVVRILPNGDPRSVLLTPEVRQRFTLLRRRWQGGKIRFDSPAAEEWGMAAIAKIV